MLYFDGEHSLICQGTLIEISNVFFGQHPERTTLLISFLGSRDRTERCGNPFRNGLSFLRVSVTDNSFCTYERIVLRHRVFQGIFDYAVYRIGFSVFNIFSTTRPLRMILLFVSHFLYL